MVLKKNPKQGEVWLFDPVKGSEVGKKIRPALIISCNTLNNGQSGLAIIMPMTSKDKGVFCHVKLEPPEGGIEMSSFVMCEQIRAISKDRLVKPLGTIKNISKLREVHSWLADFTWIEEL